MTSVIVARSGALQFSRQSKTLVKTDRKDSLRVKTAVILKPSGLHPVLLVWKSSDFIPTSAKNQTPSAYWLSQNMMSWLRLPAQ